ncbi:MAG: type II toxin-antitoxin system RelE/ParE family toxin [Galactobacillus timonensis]|uniref:type II toxin-antitoxin system RelE/ParE family toxin n=1 Tax=Galactobacillus timonensis TaxID=2041840 RepID=UPI002409A5EB|nr:type II toxin-antitoxin system RelE/ParE family toxin [Galactobacillus timonensis]MDD6599996.1 type II toxin-antitoxin system RelE/ParE family toxin [Galactobacillus timonensis]
MNILYSAQAMRDLDRIWDDIVRVSASYDTADLYINGIRDAVKEKQDHPKSGTPLYYENLFLGFWSVRHKAYRAFYRIHNDSIQVLRVLPMQADYMRILFTESPVACHDN